MSNSKIVKRNCDNHTDLYPEPYPEPLLASPNHPRLSLNAEPNHKDHDENTVGWKKWTLIDGNRYYPAGITCDELFPGIYEVKQDSNGTHFVKLKIKTEGLLEFPESNSKKVIEEIKTFWEQRAAYEAHNLSYKRGILLYGPPGSGKSCTIQLIIEDVIKRGGICIKYNFYSLVIDGLRLIRQIQQKTPIVVLLEDIDSILDNDGESHVLNMLDGSENVDGVVFLATTNYPEMLGPRVINRPSRFDRRLKMPHPSSCSRKLYFEHLALLHKSNNGNGIIDIDKWVKDTEDMSIAHLRELFIAVIILGCSYKETLSLLKDMVEERISSTEDDGNIGFN